PQDSGLVVTVEEAPYPLPVGTANAAVCRIDNKIFVIGGFNYGIMPNMYRLNAGTWQQMPSMETPVGGPASTTVMSPDGYQQALLLGGVGPDGDQALGYLVDGEGVVSTFEHSMPSPRSFFSLVFDGYDLVAAGGSIGDISGRVRMDSVMVFELHGRNNAASPERQAGLPEAVQVRAFPNPSNSMTRITVDRGLLNGPLRLSLYNLLGQEVTSWALPPGRGAVTVTWDGTASGKPVGAGVYFLRSQLGDQHIGVTKIHRLP
ncbi:T9SS type A sorting domain-containing protein, partial [bacterium]|nr:T9SS type A sorting domain-containing protein [bacterium]